MGQETTYGSMMEALKDKVIKRFMRNVKKNKTTGCWMWNRKSRFVSTDVESFKTPWSRTPAQFALAMKESFSRALPTGSTTCGDQKCVNPEHMSSCK